MHSDDFFETNALACTAMLHYVMPMNKSKCALSLTKTSGYGGSVYRSLDAILAASNLLRNSARVPMGSMIGRSCFATAVALAASSSKNTSIYIYIYIH
jgi:hypothetical protein